MTTRATLYRDGTLLCDVHTDCRNPTQGLRGRALLLVLDAAGRILARFEVVCSTRGGLLDFFTESSGRETMRYSVAQDVAARAARLEVWQANKENFEALEARILKVKARVVDALDVIR